MKILGLDIGTTSIGSTLIEYDDNRQHGRILFMGCRIFPEARDPKGLEPTNQRRRQQRLARRQQRRRKQRRRALNEQLANSACCHPTKAPNGRRS